MTVSPSVPAELLHAATLRVRQVRELGELFLGIETRNKYAICTEDGQQVAFAAEQQKGIAGYLLRQFLGHWRRFDILVFDAQRRPVLRAEHPFRIFMQRIDVYDADSGGLLGSLQERFSFLRKRFDVLDSAGRVVLEMRSGFFRMWSFPLFRGSREVARIEKKWSGAFNELFTDKDNFRVVLTQELSAVERVLTTVAAIFVDLQYFEKKKS